MMYKKEFFPFTVINKIKSTRNSKKHNEAIDRELNQKRRALRSTTHCLVIGGDQSGKTSLIEQFKIAVGANQTDQMTGEFYLNELRKLLLSFLQKKSITSVHLDMCDEYSIFVKINNINLDNVQDSDMDIISKCCSAYIKNRNEEDTTEVEKYCLDN